MMVLREGTVLTAPWTRSSSSASSSSSVPTLKVGTLDSLMSLSDDLERVDRYVESVVHRLEKEIRNLINSDANLDRETPAQVVCVSRDRGFRV